MKLPSITQRDVRQSLADRGRLLAGAVVAVSTSLLMTGMAMAQTTTTTTTASSVAGGLGEQMNAMSSEAINSGSTAFGGACYLAAAVCFFFGVWAFWQSRQPQNRESGHMGRAIAGMALCGLFATGGTWINKAAHTASGADASINNTPAMVTFK